MEVSNRLFTHTKWRKANDFGWTTCFLYSSVNSNYHSLLWSCPFAPFCSLLCIRLSAGLQAPRQHAHRADCVHRHKGGKGATHPGVKEKQYLHFRSPLGVASGLHLSQLDAHLVLSTIFLILALIFSQWLGMWVVTNRIMQKTKTLFCIQSLLLPSLLWGVTVYSPECYTMLKRKQEHAPDKGEQDGRELFFRKQEITSAEAKLWKHISRE